METTTNINSSIMMEVPPFKEEEILNNVYEYEEIFGRAIFAVLTNKSFHLFNETVLNIEKLRSDSYAYVMNVNSEKCREFALILEKATLEGIIKTSDSILFDILKQSETSSDTEETVTYEKLETMVSKHGTCVIDDSITDIDELREEMENLGFDWDKCVLYLYGGTDALKERAKLEMQRAIRRTLTIRDCYHTLLIETQNLRTIMKELKRIIQSCYRKQKHLWEDNKEKYAQIRNGRVLKTNIDWFPETIQNEIYVNQSIMEEFQQIKDTVKEAYNTLWNFMLYIDPNNGRPEVESPDNSV